LFTTNAPSGRVVGYVSVLPTPGTIPPVAIFLGIVVSVEYPAPYVLIPRDLAIVSITALPFLPDLKISLMFDFPVGLTIG
jgi:hypothetical protein